MNHGELSAGQIKALLQELSRRLEAKGMSGDIRLVGGAALILQGIAVRATADIDASYADKDAVGGIVAEMADQYGLAADWLNSNSSAFVPDGASWVDLESLGALTVRAADMQTLLAMKIAAEREKDIPDIARLLNELGISDPEEAVDVAYEKYGEDSIPLAAGRENYLIVVEDAMAARQIVSIRTAEAGGRGELWVAPHIRDGRHVEGHFRRRPEAGD